ncbi:hydrogenase expression/formation protein HypE (plasmid) [Acaryochloris sp. 'Moss Beach']|uniref:hydrogenase expression/formation protein HypE n=1 Tax=Acaryochloris sp. 'Moss Beach' TaxID=2740837 RepID=UPI001F371A0F|nr:hydrogenase expression/formation protein HypE [Acaryochloris sp. 'Moss Beach']UJB72577.1 hydrogenase expression/formation protein HypE [Acaryochloris sp. 'Moss Beach']
MPIDSISCPIPIEQYPQVLLAHGGGGKLMHQLIEQMFGCLFQSEYRHHHDAAALDFPPGRLALTTDSYVVHPLFFPGGDIGSLAVYGTVNDLAMAGARPLYLSTSFILEEGLPMTTLWQVVQSMQQAAHQADVQIVTGDTKVVERGKGDGVFINTAGVGVIEHLQTIHPQSIQPGDLVILNGDLGRHGMAVLAEREGLEFESEIKSDSAPLNHVVLDLIAHGVELHCMRDLTRGGLASALNEIALAARVTMTSGRSLAITLDETCIPIREDVQGACEILGFDPLYVANEGRFIAFVPPQSVDLALARLNAPLSFPLSGQSNTNPQMKHRYPARVIGQVTTAAFPRVTLTNRIGVERIVNFLSGEQLPRIC